MNGDNAVSISDVEYGAKSRERTKSFVEPSYNETISETEEEHCFPADDKNEKDY